MPRKAFIKQRLSAEKHLSEQLEKYNPLKELPLCVRVLCPGAGLLPSLQTLVNTLLAKGAHEIEIVCVDPHVSAEEFLDHHSDDQLQRQAHQADTMSVEFVQKDILNFLFNYDAHTQGLFDIVYYEHPFTLSLMALLSSDAKEYLSSFAYLPRVVKSGALILGSCYTVMELAELKDLLAYTLPLDRKTFHTQRYYPALVYPVRAYGNNFFARVGNEITREPTHIEETLKNIRFNHLFHLIFISIAFYFSFTSKPFYALHLLTGTADRTELFSLATLLCLTAQLNHLQGIRGFAQHALLLLAELFFYYQQEANTLEPVTTRRL